MNNISKQLHKINELVGRYIVVLFFVIFGAMYGFLIYTSGQQSLGEPTESQINEKFQAAKRPKVNDESAEALRELSDQNIEVKALFDDARNNPFAE